MNNNLEEFGKYFIEMVRDSTIYQKQRTLEGKMKGKKSQEIYKKFCEEPLSKEFIINELLPYIVDTALFEMLNSIEQNEKISLSYNNDDLNSASDGLAGELFTEDGWIQKFSKYPHTEF